MSSKKSDLETEFDYNRVKELIAYLEDKYLKVEVTEDPQLTETTHEVDNPYVIINRLISKNWHLEGKLRELERDYKEKYENLAEENKENIRNYTNQIKSLENKINTLIKSKERKFDIPNKLIEEKVKEYLEQEKEES